MTSGSNDWDMPYDANVLCAICEENRKILGYAWGFEEAYEFVEGGEDE